MGVILMDLIMTKRTVSSDEYCEIGPGTVLTHITSGITVTVIRKVMFGLKTDAGFIDKHVLCYSYKIV